MIVVSGVIEVAAENRDQAVAAIVALARVTRLETGCLSYAFYEDVEQTNRFRVFGEWRDAEALQKHFRTPHMAAFRDQLIGVEILSRKVQRYDVSAVSEL